MKINWNKKYTTVAIYALTVIIVSILFVVFVFKFDSFKQTFSWVGKIIAPIICGIDMLCRALFLNARGNRGGSCAMPV